MTRFRMIVVAALVACLTLPVATASARPSAEVLMVRKVNAFRHQHGLPGVHMSRSLMRSSERYSWKQMNSGYFGHSSRIQASSRYRRLGEIIEWHRGLEARVSQAFHAWLNSPGHRAIIVDRNFKYAGAGRASGRFNGHNATIWTMHFGSK